MERRVSRTSSNFADNVLTCVNDIADVIPRLTRRYDARVVVNAFASHTSLALRSLVERGVCDAAQAQAVLRHVEQTVLGKTAFQDDPEAQTAETPANE
jgi:ribose 1,5-bisphosphokinase PhnN